MATPKKTKSSKWRVRVYVGTDESGPHYKSVTADTKALCLAKAAQISEGKPQPAKEELTIRMAIERYIDLSRTLSPTTLHSYDRILSYAFPSIMDRAVSDLDDIDMQDAINKEMSRKNERTGKPLSPKTVKNEWGLIAAALKTIAKRSYSIRLPKIARKMDDLPEVSEITEVIRGTPVELPCLLAMWLSFSMSEVRGIMCSSVRNGSIYIERVVVDVGGVKTVKDTAKTDTRIRIQRIPGYIMQLIETQDSYIRWKKEKKDGFLIEMTRNQIYHYFTRRCQAAGLDLSFHDLRHVFASVMLTELNVPEKIVQQEGGWSTPHVMKSVYSQTFSSSRQRADDLRDAYFSQYMTQNNDGDTKKD